MTSRNRAVLIVFLILLAILNGYFLAWPASGTLKTVNTQVAATEADVNLAQQKITDLGEFDQLIKKYPAEADLLSLAAPSDLDLPQFMVAVEAIASKSSVTLSSIQPPAQGAQDVSIQISGSFDGLFAFMTNLEKNLRPVKVSEIQIAAATEGAQTSMTVKLTPLTLAKTSNKSAAGATGSEAGAPNSSQTQSEQGTGTTTTGTTP